MCELMLQILKEIIVTGWPETVNDLTTDVRPFWSIQDQLSIHYGIIMKGQLVIPNTMHQNILKNAAYSTYGKGKIQLLAKNTVYWLTINADISLDLIDASRFVLNTIVCSRQNHSNNMMYPLHHELCLVQIYLSYATPNT